MNVLESTQLWRDVVTDQAAEDRTLSCRHMLVNNAAMQLVQTRNSST